MTEIGPGGDVAGSLAPEPGRAEADISGPDPWPPPGEAAIGGGEGESHGDSLVRPLAQRLEAILIVVDEPMTATALGRLLNVPEADVEAELRRLRTAYESDVRGFELREVAGGWRYYSVVSCADDVERYVLDGAQARLTHAALETLAVIAYRQPVSRQSVAAIRGVGVDGVVRTLIGRGLIAESGSGIAGATLYVTTEYFLDRLGLRSLDELPSLAPYLPDSLDDFDDLL